MLLSIKLNSFRPISLNDATNKLVKLSKTYNLTSSLVPLPLKIQKFTVLRGPHVNKKAREQFEMRTHSKLLVLTASNLSNAEYTTFLKKSVEIFSSFPISVNVKLKSSLL